MLLTEQEIRNIIEEEIITVLVEEGFLQNLGKKAGKAMLPLAMAAGLSGMAGTAQAAPSLQSTETPIAQVALSPTSQKISKELKKLGQDLSVDDVNELGKLVDKLNKVNDRLVPAIANAIDASLKMGESKDVAIARVQKKLRRAVNGPKLKIINEFAGFALDPSSESADRLGDAIVAAVKGGNISKELGRKIFELAKNPGENAGKVQSMLGF
jgi:hypothetical protein